MEEGQGRVVGHELRGIGVVQSLADVLHDGSFGMELHTDGTRLVGALDALYHVNARHGGGGSTVTVTPASRKASIMFVQNSLSVSARQAMAIRNSFSLLSDVFSLLLYAADKVMQQMMMASTKITFFFIVLSSFYYCFFELPLVIVFFMAKLRKKVEYINAFRKINAE